MIKILLGGSPCTYWSIAQKNNRETVASGLGWELFCNYLVAKQKFNPDIFLYENNKSASQVIKDQIKQELKVWDGTLLTEDSKARYIEIDSALLSAQTRKRFYVHNCGDIRQPQDKGILVNEILENGGGLGAKTGLYAIPVRTTKDGKAHTIKAQQGKSSVANFITNNGYGATGVAEKVQGNAKGTVYKVENGLITIRGGQYPIRLADGYYIIRKLSVTECCRLQTLPDDYCRAVSMTQAYKGIGNGWTADVICYILWHTLKDIPKDEPLIVLSMYDGIGTGRYCLDKLGFTNIKYYAYEIDEFAMKVANSNYPDIIQCGDAYKVLADDWMLQC